MEVSTEEARFISEIGEYDLSVVEIKNGPEIVIGKDFLGYGYVHSIYILRSNPQLPLLLKVKLS